MTPTDSVVLITDDRSADTWLDFGLSVKVNESPDEAAFTDAQIAAAKHELKRVRLERDLLCAQIFERYSVEIEPCRYPEIKL